MTKQETQELRDLVWRSGLAGMKIDDAGIAAMQEYDLLDSAVDFIEKHSFYVCKYKHKGHKWLFMFEPGKNEKWLIVFTDPEEFPMEFRNDYTMDEVDFETLIRLVSRFHNTPGFIINPCVDNIMFRMERVQNVKV